MRRKTVGKAFVALLLCTSLTAGYALPAFAEDLSVMPVAEMTAESSPASEEETSEKESTVSDSIAEEAVKKAVTEGKYLKELRVASADSEDKAKSLLTESGYTVIDQNVNQDADVLLSSKKAVYIGYTTTDNVAEAVRDISLMNMNGKYVLTDYKTALEDQLDSFSQIEAEQIAIVKEFRENYNAGAALAVDAYHQLNLFREDNSGLLLGDFLLQVDLTPSTKEHISDFLSFISTISNEALTMVDTVLACGLASFGEDNYLQQVENMTESEITEAKASRVNLSHAETLFPYIQVFSNAMQSTVETMETEGISVERLKEEDELTDQEKYLITQDLFLTVLGTYDYDGQTFADLILDPDLSAADLTLLVSQMSDAQMYAAKYVGFQQILMAETADSSKWSESGLKDQFDELRTKQMKSISEQMQPYTENDSVVSIYYGVDKDSLEGTIGVTSDAIRQMEATQDHSAILGYEDDNDGWILSAGLVLGASAAIMFMIGIVEKLAGPEVIVEDATVVHEFVNNVEFDLSTGAAAEFVQEWAEHDQMISNRIQLVDNVWANVVLAGAIAIVAILVCGYFVYKDYTAKHKIFDKSAIPNVMIDERTTDSGVPYYVRYHSVRDFTTTNDELDPGDVNGYVGDQWNVLYTTANVDAGDPVQADFRVSVGSASPKKGELGFHAFGSNEEQNLNTYTYNEKSADKIYIYAKTGVVTSLIASIFTGTGGYIVMLILGLIAGALLMTVMSVLRRKKKNIV